MPPDAIASPIPDITVILVRRLLRDQFPHWAHLPITPAIPQGWDNRTFRLGEELGVRLPSAVGYTPQVAKEHQYLPRLAPLLPLPIPVPIARGQPGAGYPWPWSMFRWLPGETAEPTRISDLVQFATTLAHFLIALQQIDPADGPPPGFHSAYRGGPLTTYDAETRRSLHTLDKDIDTAAATAVWETALDAPWAGPPVWFHGDVAAGNLLIRDGQLAAVIDFGCAGVGDPACDMVIAWTLLERASRAAFRTTLQVDDYTWARGRGWALWKALITLADDRQTTPAKAADARGVIDAILADAMDAT